MTEAESDVNMTVRIVLLAICASAALSSLSARAEDFRAEAAFLANEIVTIHPRGAEIAKDPDFIAARDALFAIAGAPDLPHYAMAAGRMFHAADDGHTALIPVYSELPEFTARYPFRLQRFEDGLYVVAASGDAAALLGTLLTKIAGKDVHAVLRDFAAAQASGNRAWPANWTALGMSLPGFLIGLDVAPDAMTVPVVFEGRTASGQRRTAALLPSADSRESLVEIDREPGPLEKGGGGPLNYVVDMAEQRALVLVIGGMEDEDGRSFETFAKEAIAAVEATRARKLIIDLRENGGGNNMLAEPLRRVIIKSRFNKPGGIYVLTAPQTFSAAQNFATRLERETGALFVGEPTGGSPNHFGDPKFGQGTQSNIPYIVSTLRWQDMPPMDEREWILPDLPAPPSFEAFIAGRDLALEAALADERESDPEWWQRVMTPWERDSQLAEWRFFYEAEPGPAR